MKRRSSYQMPARGPETAPQRRRRVKRENTLSARAERREARERALAEFEKMLANLPTEEEAQALLEEADDGEE